MVEGAMEMATDMISVLWHYQTKIVHLQSVKNQWMRVLKRVSRGLKTILFSINFKKNGLTVKGALLWNLMRHAITRVFFIPKKVVVFKFDVFQKFRE
jgi:hypothetical protein